MDTSNKLHRCALLGLIITGILTGCGSDDGDTDVFVLSISDRPEVCDAGVEDAVYFCPPPAYNVKTGAKDDYPLIEGFTHEFGVAYELRVQTIPEDEYLADGDNYDYRLLDTISSTQVAEVGDIYTFDIPLNGYMFQLKDGEYFLQYYQFNCGEGVDCEELREIDGSGGIASIEFTYVGGDIPITLTSWN